jgi:hypothetical protein
MNGEIINEWCADTRYKIRCIKSLIAQTQNDYAELNQLWQKFDDNKIGEIEIDELLKKISWVKQELNIFIEFRNKDVEGVLWGDAENIAKDLQIKENQLTKITRSVSDETKHSHLR